MQFFKETHIDFVKLMKYAVISSVLVILIGLVSLVLKGGPKKGIDFTGGTTIRLKFEKPLQVSAIRDVLSSLGQGKSEILKMGSGNEIIISIPQQTDIGDVTEKVLAELKAKLADNPFEVNERDTVGPRIGQELARAALWAIFWSMILLLIYISYRFEFKFAVGAIVALIHDVTITLGLFSLLNMEVSLSVLAAFLTLVGYSLNDTIVVFDRIRENMKTMRRESLVTIINISVNQTLSRTVLTSLVTLLVVILLFFFGGEVLHNFSFALLAGIIVGTYSSVFIAAPIVVAWKMSEEKSKSRK
jgi:preprotein translocase subunit SecF